MPLFALAVLALSPTVFGASIGAQPLGSGSYDFQGHVAGAGGAGLFFQPLELRDEYRFELAETSTVSVDIDDVRKKGLIFFLQLDGEIIGGGGQGRNFTVGPLKPDTEYTLAVSGEFTGAGRVNYAGAVNVAPVPLPAAGGLFLSALGVLGAGARWRRRSAQPA